MSNGKIAAELDQQKMNLSYWVYIVIPHCTEATGLILLCSGLHGKFMQKTGPHCFSLKISVIVSKCPISLKMEAESKLMNLSLMSQYIS